MSGNPLSSVRRYPAVSGCIGSQRKEGTKQYFAALLKSKTLAKWSTKPFPCFCPLSLPSSQSFWYWEKPLTMHIMSTTLSYAVAFRLWVGNKLTTAMLKMLWSLLYIWAKSWEENEQLQDRSIMPGINYLMKRDMRNTCFGHECTCAHASLVSTAEGFPDNWRKSIN